jgi:hypothetical protein
MPGISTLSIFTAIEIIRLTGVVCLVNAMRHGLTLPSLYRQLHYMDPM